MQVISSWIDTNTDQAGLNHTIKAGESSGGKFNGSFINPHEVLGYYGVILGSTIEVVASGLSNPSGLVLAGGALYVAEQASYRSVRSKVTIKGMGNGLRQQHIS